ncbi:MAG: response regulator [Thermodesulfobacteriota bacterium]
MGAGGEAGARVLVVDDAPFLRRRLRDILEAAGHRVVAEAEDGDQALALYEEHLPDVVTLDLVMPRRDGLETLRALRARHPDAAVIVCTSLSGEPALLEAVRLGACDYVLKPVSPGRLLEAVAKALEAVRRARGPRPQGAGAGGGAAPGAPEGRKP